MVLLVPTFQSLPSGFLGRLSTLHFWSLERTCFFFILCFAAAEDFDRLAHFEGFDGAATCAGAAVGASLATCAGTAVDVPLDASRDCWRALAREERAIVVLVLVVVVGEYSSDVWSLEICEFEVSDADVVLG